MTKIMTIKAAEGGADSRMLCCLFARSYMETAKRLGWVTRLRAGDPGCPDGQREIAIIVAGEGTDALENEAGGHRIQRVPPTEKSGRTHTSTITVSVTPNPWPHSFTMDDKDVAVSWYSGTGAGGQHRNKNMCCCRVTHIPTGTTRIGTDSRSRKTNLTLAMAELKKAVSEKKRRKIDMEIGETMRKQAGSGMRGDKVRTYRQKDDTAKDHRTGTTIPMSKALSGYMDLFWPKK